MRQKRREVEGGRREREKEKEREEKEYTHTHIITSCCGKTYDGGDRVEV